MEIRVSELTKKYKTKVALEGIHLVVKEGMFGLLGPNGAGKTTLMRILTTLIPKTKGTVTMNNIPIEDKKRIREMIGYLPQDFSLYPSMTVYESMDYLGILSGIVNRHKRKERIEELLEKVNLNNDLKVKVKQLSGGMKRRLGIAQALLNNPKILIVDEPTAGLDPEERIRFRNLLRDFSDDRIVILSTHIIEDIEFTCENLAVLKQGKILFEGKVTDMLKKASGCVWTFTDEKDQLNSIRNKYTIISSVSEDSKMKLRVLSKERPVVEAVEAKPTIEDAYMYIMKEV